MTINSNKRTTNNKVVQRNQKFGLHATFLLLDSIDTIIGVFIISSHIITKVITRPFMQVQFFKYSSITKSLSHSQAVILEFQA